MAPCAVSDSVVLSSDLIHAQDSSASKDVHDMAELVAGYLECMEEAVRYLVEEERYPEWHPAVLGLRRHLAEYHERLVEGALASCQRVASGDLQRQSSRSGDTAATNCDVLEQLKR